MNVLTKVMAVMVFLLSISPAWMFSSQAEVGTGIPEFEVESGSDEVLTQKGLKGNVIILYYETKDNKEMNRPLKNYLSGVIKKQGGNFHTGYKIVAIVDASQSRPFTGIWKKNLRKNTRLEGLTIYGDWTGNMKKDFGFSMDVPYFLIIDQNGIIKIKYTGKVSKSRFEHVEQTFLNLVQ